MALVESSTHGRRARANPFDAARVGRSVSKLRRARRSYFDANNRAWVLDRRVIAWRYARTWFFFDAASVLPVDCVTVFKAFKYARLVRVLRFFKLLKVLKSPRVIQAISMHWDFSSKLQATAKYVVMLLFTVHWSACSLRLLTLVACDAGSGPHSRGGAGDGGDGTSGGCPNTVLTEGYNWGDGAWATYIEAAVWANMALNGEATYRLHSEGVLGILVMLFGFILLGFLLGELTNTMTNLDPVGNKFKQTRDSLTEFMSKHQFSSSLRRKLKEYITLSEPIFRENHYAQILTKLSPRFKHIVANNVSGYLVTQIPFIRYATQHVAGVAEGSLLWVEYDGVLRKCRVVMIPSYLSYDVLYLDNGQREYGVPHHRVDVARTCETDAARERVFRLVYEQDSLVVRIAHHFEAQLYMGRDTVVLRDMSVNDALYVRGRATRKGGGGRRRAVRTRAPRRSSRSATSWSSARRPRASSSARRSGARSTSATTCPCSSAGIGSRSSSTTA